MKWRLLKHRTEVLVIPFEAVLGSPQAVLAAMDAPPHLKQEDVEELRRLIERRIDEKSAKGQA